LFPIPLPDTWYSAKEMLTQVQDPIAADWIKCESSLTVRIKELGIAFNVDVLNQCQRNLTQVQRGLVDTQDESGLFREVLLKQGELPLVYAQTIMPDSTVSGTESMLSKLGNQSLGQVLFQSPQATRGEIEYSEVKADTELGQFIEKTLKQPIEQTCYIRRSLFLLNNKPLLVCECFLPALFL